MVLAFVNVLLKEFKMYDTQDIVCNLALMRELRMQLNDLSLTQPAVPSLVLANNFSLFYVLVPLSSHHAH